MRGHLKRMSTVSSKEHCASGPFSLRLMPWRVMAMKWPRDVMESPQRRQVAVVDVRAIKLDHSTNLLHRMGAIAQHAVHQPTAAHDSELCEAG